MCMFMFVFISAYTRMYSPMIYQCLYYKYDIVK